MLPHQERLRLQNSLEFSAVLHYTLKLAWKRSYDCLFCNVYSSETVSWMRRNMGWECFHNSLHTKGQINIEHVTFFLVNIFLKVLLAWNWQHRLIGKMCLRTHFWELRNMRLWVHMPACFSLNECYGAVLISVWTAFPAWLICVVAHHEWCQT